MADPEPSLLVLAGGQPGKWHSPHYADQLPLWRKARYRGMLREGHPLEHRLILRPF